MNTKTIKNLTIGAGAPKICVPITGATQEALLREINALRGEPADLVEWRMDFFTEVDATSAVIATLKKLSPLPRDMPLLATFRTQNEGGKREFSLEQYESLLTTICESELVDMIDVELFVGEEVFSRLVSVAHQHNILVIASNHDFDKTPPKAEIIQRLCKMQEYHADILKIAVMPQSAQDVIELLSATEVMHNTLATRPTVTMSMGSLGAVSRICGETFGSAITFGSVGQASAPGQIPADSLSYVLNLLHQNTSTQEESHG